MDKTRAISHYELQISKCYVLLDSAAKRGDTIEEEGWREEIQRLEMRINDLMNWPDFKGADDRLNARVLTRKEYKQFSRLARQNKIGYMSAAANIGHHFEEGRNWVRWVKRCSKIYEGDMFLYHAASEGYALRIDEAIADWGGSMWEAELERAVSSYHFWGDSGGLRIS